MIKKVKITFFPKKKKFEERKAFGCRRGCTYSNGEQCSKTGLIGSIAYTMSSLPA